MMAGNLVIIFILGVVVGVGIAYALFQQQSSKQKQGIEERIRQEREEQEKIHQIREQQAVQQVQQEHQNQLQQVRETLETEYHAEREQMGLQLQEKDSQIQQMSQSLANSEAQVQQLQEQLQNSEAQVIELNQTLSEYATLLERLTTQLQATQAQVEQLNQSSVEETVEPSVLAEETTPAVELTLTLPETQEEASFIEEEVTETPLTIIEVEPSTVS